LCNRHYEIGKCPDLRSDGEIVANLSFGPFEIDLERAVLRRAGVTIHLRSQAVRLLILLATRAGEVVSREEIQRALWSDGTFVDFEHSINVCIRQIRGALGDTHDRQQFIETLPRRGYRFAAAVVLRGNLDAPVLRQAAVERERQMAAP
jgi:DNA-binding winged helix-turn-helix (wHTH) protein